MAINEKIIAAAVLDDLVTVLLDTPNKLYELRVKRAGLMSAMREADENLAIASLPLEADAYSSGKNEAERKTRLKSLQAADKSYQSAKMHQVTLDGEVAMLDVEVRHLEEKFAAIRAVAKLETARLSFLAEE